MESFNFVLVFLTPLIVLSSGGQSVYKTDCISDTDCELNLICDSRFKICECPINMLWDSYLQRCMLKEAASCLIDATGHNLKTTPNCIANASCISGKCQCRVNDGYLRNNFGGCDL